MPALPGFAAFGIGALPNRRAALLIFFALPASTCSLIFVRARSDEHTPLRVRPEIGHVAVPP